MYLQSKVSEVMIDYSALLHIQRLVGQNEAHGM